MLFRDRRPTHVEVGESAIYSRADDLDLVRDWVGDRQSVHERRGDVGDDLRVRRGRGIAACIVGLRDCDVPLPLLEPHLAVGHDGGVEGFDRIALVAVCDELVVCALVDAAPENAVAVDAAYVTHEVDASGEAEQTAVASEAEVGVGETEAGELLGRKDLVHEAKVHQMKSKHNRQFDNCG